MKYYFRSDDSDGNCYTIKQIKEDMKEQGISELKVFEAIREVGGDYFYCKKYYEIGDKSEGGCGKICDEYKPRNGKSGRCIHHSHTYEQGEKELIIKLNP